MYCMPSDSDDEPLTAALESEKVIFMQIDHFENEIRVERRGNLHQKDI